MATPISYTPLEGGTINSLGVDVSKLTSISEPTLFSSTSFIWSLAFVVIIVTASFRYAYAGILRIQATEKGIKDSKEEFTRVTYGLLGVLGLWLILYTVNKDMLTGNVGLDGLKLNRSTTVNTPTNTTTRPTSGMDTPTIPTNNDDPTGWGAIQNDVAVRNQLYANNITVNKRVCNNPTQTSCTTVGGLPPETLTMLSQLRATCSGTITITGGSENGHKSHGVGKTPVDISINSPGGLNDCIRSFPKGPDQKTWCKATYDKFGYRFCDELFTDPHWHVYKP